MNESAVFPSLATLGVGLACIAFYGLLIEPVPIGAIHAIPWMVAGVVAWRSGLLEGEEVRSGGDGS